MKFYDNDLNAYVETKDEEGKVTLYIKDSRYPLSISSELLQKYPEWVAKDAVRLMARRISRKNQLDQLAEMIIKEER